jgi:hypothetical protein
VSNRAKNVVTSNALRAWVSGVMHEDIASCAGSGIQLPIP